MEDRNCEVLLEYLRTILYDTDASPLDLEQLDEPYRDLGRGMRFLHTAVQEMLSYSEDLSRGNLSTDLPNKDNFLCTNLKNLHATLNHLTWQAKQVASGDYSQHVSYLGEFSKAFNTMTEQLKEREAQLLEESKDIRQRSEMLSVYNELLINMTAGRQEWIVVVNAQTKDVVYCNKTGHKEEQFSSSLCSNCIHRQPGRSVILSWSGSQHESWEFQPFPNKYYHVDSYPISWNGQQSYVHVVADITDQHLEIDDLSHKAYLDPVTSIHNRNYFDEYMANVLAEHLTVTLCFLDLDGLKYVNDHFSHVEGDNYLLDFVKLIRRNFRSDDIFTRIGGDEFCIILSGDLVELAHRKLETVRDQMIANNSKSYPVSFSYGIYLVDGDAEPVSIESIMQDVDTRMYEYKRKYKKERPIQ